MLPTFANLLTAAQRGFAWSESLGRFVRFLQRADRNGYDVLVLTEDQVGQVHPLFSEQFPSIPISEETLRRLVSLSPALADLRTPLDNEPMVRLVLDFNGHALDLKHERRVIGL